MRAPGPLVRFGLLLRLKLKLTARAAGSSTGRAIAVIVGWILVLVWATVIGLGAYSFGRDHLDLAGPGVHLLFLGTITLQVLIGVVSLVAGEFFDVSRLLHLPLGHREVFAAMAVGTLLNPFTLVFLAPILGTTFALGGDAVAIGLRVGAGLLLLAMGNAVALLLNLVLLNFLSRRRLRDIATLVAGLLVPSAYLAFRGMTVEGSTDGGGFERLLRADPAAGFHWLPPSWLAELYLGAEPLRAAALVAAIALLTSALLLAGARALKAAFDGQLPGPSQREVSRGEVERPTLLPADLAVMANVAKTLFAREPQLKALYLQQTVFMVAPVFFLVMGRGSDDVVARGAAEGGGFLVIMLPSMLALSHLVFLQSLFGIDGKGIVQLLLAPVTRRRMLLARGLAWFGMVLVSDLVVAAVILVGLGAVHGGPWSLLPQLPWIYVAVLIFDLVLLALGTVTSVYWPTRLASSGRRAIQRQRSENVSFASQLVRMLVFFPALAVAAALAFGALLPHFLDGLLSRRWLLATVPAGVAAAAVLYGITVYVMGGRLAAREERLVAALADTGD